MKHFHEWLTRENDKEIDFFEKRKKGAAEIAQKAQAKGGPSILTMWHFKAKHMPYQEVLRAIKDGKDKSFFKSKYTAILSKLGRDMKQEEFQKTIGEAEVWGEAICELFPKAK